MPITHAKVSTIPDGGDEDLVRPSDWNADHEIVGSTTLEEGSLYLDGSTFPETIGPEIHWYGRSGRWLTGVDVANALKSRDFVLAGRLYAFAFDDGVTTNGSTTLTSAAQGGFASSMVGAALAGAGIPAGATVAAVASATSLTMSAAATASATGVRVEVSQSGVTDEFYMKHRGRLASTLGIGVTPPNGNYRFQIAASDAEVAMGGLSIRVGPSQTGHPLIVHDSNGNSTGGKFWITKDFYLQGASTFGVRVQAESTNERALLVANSAKSAIYGFQFSSNSCQFRYLTGAVTLLQFDTDGSVRHISSKIGFYNATPATKPTVTGSRSDGTALASLLSALATLGLITDSSTA